MTAPRIHGAAFRPVARPGAFLPKAGPVCWRAISAMRAAAVSTPWDFGGSPIATRRVLELDESYFGPRRGWETIVFGLLKRGDSIYTAIVPNAGKAAPQR